jgi:hypothetical protein
MQNEGLLDADEVSRVLHSIQVSLGLSHIEVHAGGAEVPTQQHTNITDKGELHFQTLLRLGDVTESDMEQPTIVRGWRRENHKTHVVKMFLRPHLVDKKDLVDQFMNQDQKKRLYVSGPPGCGKTTFFLAYFTRWARKQKKVGLVVQYRELSSCEIVILRGDQDPQFVQSDRLTRSKLGDLVEDIAKNQMPPFDFCLLDGARQKIDGCKNIMSYINLHFIDRKVIHITSLEFDIKGGEASGGTFGIDQHLHVDSWVRSEYESCYDAGLLSHEEWIHLLETEEDDEEIGSDEEDGSNSNDEEKEDLAKIGAEMETDEKEATERKALVVALIERKFFYAGGSARLFFDHSLIDLLETELKSLENRVSNEMWTEFAELSIGYKTPSSVSTLLQKIGQEVFPVSKYFMFLGYQKRKSQLVMALKAAARAADNPAMKGWAFELEQIDIVTTKAEISHSVSNDDGSLVLPVQNAFVEYDGALLTGDTESQAFVIFCKKWNQGCFDLAFVFGDELVTTNFTISAEHSLKVWYIRDLKIALKKNGREVTKVTHLAVLDAVSTFERFKFKEATGTGFDNGKNPALYKIRTAAATKFARPTVLPHYHVQTVDGKSDQDAVNPITAKLGKELEKIGIFPNRQGERKVDRYTP